MNPNYYSSLIFYGCLNIYHYSYPLIDLNLFDLYPFNHHNHLINIFFTVDSNDTLLNHHLEILI
jgi:hypothetical protein